MPNINCFFTLPVCLLNYLITFLDLKSSLNFRYLFKTKLRHKLFWLDEIVQDLKLNAFISPFLCKLSCLNITSDTFFNLQIRDVKNALINLSQIYIMNISNISDLHLEWLVTFINPKVLNIVFNNNNFINCNKLVKLWRLRYLSIATTSDNYIILPYIPHLKQIKVNNYLMLIEPNKLINNTIIIKGIEIIYITRNINVFNILPKNIVNKILNNLDLKSAVQFRSIFKYKKRKSLFYKDYFVQNAKLKLNAFVTPFLSKIRHLCIENDNFFNANNFALFNLRNILNITVKNLTNVNLIKVLKIIKPYVLTIHLNTEFQYTQFYDFLKFLPLHLIKLKIINAVNFDLKCINHLNITRFVLANSTITRNYALPLNIKELILIDVVIENVLDCKHLQNLKDFIYFNIKTRIGCIKKKNCEWQNFSNLHIITSYNVCNKILILLPEHML